MVEQRGFDPPAPTALKMPAGTGSFSRNSGEYWPSENLFGINSSKGATRQFIDPDENERDWICGAD
jgi:hypothetical protein